LPPLLFVTNASRLAANIGAAEARALLDMVRAAGQTVVDVGSGEPTQAARRAAGQVSGLRGIVLLGGYDVLPAERYDTLPPSLRAQIRDAQGEPDNFIVWSDQVYGDIDGDGLADLPVSRVPDGRSAELVRAALCSCPPAPLARRFGLRNAARPFADHVFSQQVPGTEQMLKSQPTASSAVDPRQVDAGAIYLLLHGSDVDTSRFWGETASGMLEAIRVATLPNPCGGIVLSGCCWGALTVRTKGVDNRPGDPVPPVTPEQSVALSFLARGARAFVGCTGAHYSPLEQPMDYFGAPMHHAFWKHVRAGVPPAEALFKAKVDYIAGMPHGRQLIEERAIENKILRQFTCLGLGW
jgi:hypothetical protein